MKKETCLGYASYVLNHMGVRKDDILYFLEVYSNEVEDIYPVFVKKNRRVRKNITKSSCAILALQVLENLGYSSGFRYRFKNLIAKTFKRLTVTAAEMYYESDAFIAVKKYQF